ALLLFVENSAQLFTDFSLFFFDFGLKAGRVRVCLCASAKLDQAWSVCRQYSPQTSGLLIAELERVANAIDERLERLRVSLSILTGLNRRNDRRQKRPRECDAKKQTKI